jgi:hypothetical protein
MAFFEKLLALLSINVAALLAALKNFGRKQIVELCMGLALSSGSFRQIR